MNEVFKDIAGFEGLYQVGNKGSVLSLRYTRRAMSPGYTGKNKKYKIVILVKNKERFTFYVHRLVAATFIENPHHYPVINHINSDPSDNRVENLEWCTQKHNIRHSINPERCKQLQSVCPKGSGHRESKPLLSLRTGIYYDSISDAGRAYGQHPDTIKRNIKLNRRQDFIYIK